MATCSILGQAIGTAVSVAVKENKRVEDIDIKALQQTLMEDDCFLPGLKRRVSELSLEADCSANIIRNGIDRGDSNCWKGKRGNFVEYTFEKDTEIKEIRLVFDSDLNRDYYNMPCSYPLVETKYKIPKTLITKYKIEGKTADGKVHIITAENHQRFVKIPVDWCVKTVRFVPLEENGCGEYRLFSFEIR